MSLVLEVVDCASVRARTTATKSDSERTRTALGAAVVLEAGVEVEPDGVVRVGGEAGAANVALGELLPGQLLQLQAVGRRG